MGERIKINFDKYEFTMPCEFSELMENTYDLKKFWDVKEMGLRDSGFFMNLLVCMEPAPDEVLKPAFDNPKYGYEGGKEFSDFLTNYVIEIKNGKEPKLEDFPENVKLFCHKNEIPITEISKNISRLPLHNKIKCYFSYLVDYNINDEYIKEKTLVFLILLNECLKEKNKENSVMYTRRALNGEMCPIDEE